MLRDLRLAIRTLWRTPGFTLIAVAALALGIGANSALFSIVYSVILRPLAVAEPERLVMVWETRPDRGFTNNVVSNANFLDWRARNKVFDGMSPLFFGTNTLGGAGEAEEVRIQMIGEEFFPMLGVTMQLGRGFTAEECKPGAPVVLILSDTLWRSKFGADVSIVGKTVRFSGEPAAVIGVAPAGTIALGDRAPALWRNARVAAVNASGTRAGGRNMAVLARLKRGVSPEAANTEMVEIARQLAIEHPIGNANWSAKVVPLNEEMTGKYQTPLFVLLGAVAVVLMIACANVANLLLTRAVGKQRDLMIRLALGATRWNLIRQLMAESMTLAVAGGLAGLVLGYALVAWLKQFGPRDVRRLEQASLDWTVIGFTVGVTLLTGLALGVVPAVVKARSTRLRDAFTVAEVALSLILLAGAGLLLKSFSNLMAVDPGFRSERVLTLDLSLPGAKYRDQKGVDFFRELTQKVRALPGIESASNITFLPFKGPGSGTYFWRADRPRPAAGQEPVTDVRMIQPGYFETLKIPLTRGRLFSEEDNRAEAPLRFVVNESMARSMFPGEDPIGKRIVVIMRADNQPGEIVGVTGDVKHAGLDGKSRPTVYYPQAHLFFNFGTLVARTAAEPSAMAKPVAAIVREMDPELAISEIGTMQGWIDQSVARPKFQAGLLAGFALLALVLATIGIYGVISFAVAQRTREIGVRMALGARPGDIAGVVLKRSAVLAGIGLTIGIAGTLALGRYVKTLLFGVEPADPATIALCAAGLFTIALAASYVPARRAGRVDPMVSLRHG